MQKVINSVLLILILGNILYVWLGVLAHPLQSMDAVGIWLFKAKAFYVEDGFPYNFLHNKLYNYSHQQYPLGLPFLFFVIYRLIGAVNEQIPLFIYPITYIGILLITYKVIKRQKDTLPALLFTYIYSMISPLIAGGGRILAGNADIFLVLIEWLILLTLYKRRQGKKEYVVMVLLIMLASQIKLEGVFLSVILLFLPIAKRSRITLFVLSLIPFLLWMLTIRLLAIPSDTHLVIPQFSLFIERIGFILLGVTKEIFNVNNWYSLGPLIFLTTFLPTKVNKQLRQIFLPSLAVIMVLFMFVYLFASNDTDTYVSSSFDRVLLQHSPILFLYFVEKMNGIIRKQNIVTEYYEKFKRKS